jgi:hypothetical protein
MLLIVIKVHVVVFQGYFLKWCTHTCIGFESWGEWIMILKPNYEFDCLCRLAFHDLLMVLVSLIIWRGGPLTVWRIGPPRRYATILHTFGCVNVVYKLGTRAWYCTIVQFLCIFFKTFTIGCTQIDAFW